MMEVKRNNKTTLNYNVPCKSKTISVVYMEAIYITDCCNKMFISKENLTEMIMMTECHYME